MKLIDANGNIFMTDSNGFSRQVINIKYGSTYGSKDEKNFKSVMVTVFPGHNNLEDSFIFYGTGNDLPITFLQSRNLNPNLKGIYLDYYINNEDKSMWNFIAIILSEYFVNILQYTHVDLPEIESANS